MGREVFGCWFFSPFLKERSKHPHSPNCPWLQSSRKLSFMLPLTLCLLAENFQGKILPSRPWCKYSRMCLSHELWKILKPLVSLKEVNGCLLNTYVYIAFLPPCLLKKNSLFRKHFIFWEHWILSFLFLSIFGKVCFWLFKDNLYSKLHLTHITSIL